MKRITEGELVQHDVLVLICVWGGSQKKEPGKIVWRVLPPWLVPRIVRYWSQPWRMVTIICVFGENYQTALLALVFGRMGPFFKKAQSDRLENVTQNGITTEIMWLFLTRSSSSSKEKCCENTKQSRGKRGTNLTARTLPIVHRTQLHENQLGMYVNISLSKTIHRFDGYPSSCSCGSVCSPATVTATASRFSSVSVRTCQGRMRCHTFSRALSY